MKPLGPEDVQGIVCLFFLNGLEKHKGRGDCRDTKAGLPILAAQNLTIRILFFLKSGLYRASGPNAGSLCLCGLWDPQICPRSLICIAPLGFKRGKLEDALGFKRGKLEDALGFKRGKLEDPETAGYRIPG